MTKHKRCVYNQNAKEVFFMNEKRSKFTAYLESCAESCREQIKKLSADGREDEAVFAKIKLNVYDIFKTVFNALGDEEKFLAKLSEINFANIAHIGNLTYRQCLLFVLLQIFYAALYYAVFI